MTKKIAITFGILCFVGLSSFSLHKFYVSIYQVDFAPQKKRFEITARIFNDDLNLALEKEFKAKISIGEANESEQDVVFLKNYLKKHFRFFVDGKEKEVVFVNKEIDQNVVIVYLKVNDVTRFKNIKISNNALLDLYDEQQNIIQTHFYNQKKNYIFSGDYFVENITVPKK